MVNIVKQQPQEGVVAARTTSRSSSNEAEDALVGLNSCNCSKAVITAAQLNIKVADVSTTSTGRRKRRNGNQITNQSELSCVPMILVVCNT